MTKNTFGVQPDSSKSIWTYNDKKIYASDLKIGLQRLGIKKGDLVMGHFDFKVLGKIGDIKNKDEFYNTVLSTILSVIGNEGALIIPAYSYSFCNGQVFDIKNTKPTIGYLAEFAFKKYKENVVLNLGRAIIRSDDPIFSCIGFGNKAKLILKDLETACFGDNSVFGRLYKYNAKLIGFGFPFAVTYMHFVERRYSELKEPLKYRFNKEFKGKKIDEDNHVSDAKHIYFVRDLKYSDYELENIPAELESQSKLKKVNVGSGTITLASAKDVYAVIFEMLDKDEFSLLTDECKKELKKSLNI